MKATVWKNGLLAGWLEATGDSTEFRYTEEYLNSNNPPIATTLPKSASPAIAPRGLLPAFFAGLLPEGIQLEKLKKAMQSHEDDLDLLVKVGAQTVGDVAVSPTSHEPQSAPVFVNLQAKPNSFAEMREVQSKVDLWAIPGAQEKYSAVGNGKSGILKVSPAEYPFLVENEYAMLKVFTSMDIVDCGVEKFHLVKDQQGQQGLFLERFDGQFPHKHGVEDASQLLGIYPADKYGVSFEDVVRALLDVVPTKAVALRDLAVQLAFAWLTGNGDLHAKNISVIHTGKGFELSPVYDIPSTLPYGDTTLALTVKGRKDGLSRKKFTGVFTELGLPEKVVEQVADEVLKHTADVADILVEVCQLDGRKERDVRRVLNYRRNMW